jgi:hypothetical protein
MEQVQLDWSTAEVSDGRLNVGLSDKPPKEWRNAFERTVTLLGARKWDVTLDTKKGSVQVASVQGGDEERVRQLLEGAALEANATLVSEQELFDGEPVDDDEQEPESDGPEPSRERILRRPAASRPQGLGDRGHRRRGPRAGLPCHETTPPYHETTPTDP